MSSKDDDTELVEGQVLGFCRALSEQVLTLGVPKMILVMNGIILYLFAVTFNFYYIVIVNVLIHFGAIYLAKNDEQFFACLQNYQSKKNYYST